MALTRRELLKSVAAAAAFTIVPRHVLGGAKFVAPSEKVNIGLIGAGGQGHVNLSNLFLEEDCQVIALADPFEETNLMPFYYKRMAGRGPGKKFIEDHYKEKTPNFTCTAYEDFRVMLEKEKAIDAVLIATPDHVHAYASVYAMRAGKHAYCEKPLTHNIREARLVAKVAAETGLATQMGNIGHSRDGMRQTLEWLWDGAIGTVREVHAWVGVKRWNPTLTGAPTDTPPVPAGANWDLWLGPRETRPYHPAYCPVTWRDFWAFGGSGLGDFGCHDMDSAVWALGLMAPESVEARPAGVMDKEIAPHGCQVFYKFGSREGMKETGEDENFVRPKKGRGFTDAPVTLTWYDGGLMPPTPEEMLGGEAPPAPEPRGKGKGKVKGKGKAQGGRAAARVLLPGRGVLFVGDKGKILEEGAGGVPRLLPYEATGKYTKPAETLTRSKGHHRDWLDAIKGGKPASSNFKYAARLTEIVNLGIMAVRTNQFIKWDPKTMKVPGVEEAEAIINGQYRQGWEVV